MASYVMKLWRHFERHVFSTFLLTYFSIPIRPNTIYTLGFSVKKLKKIFFLFKIGRYQNINNLILWHFGIFQFHCVAFITRWWLMPITNISNSHDVRIFIFWKNIPTITSNSHSDMLPGVSREKAPPRTRFTSYLSFYFRDKSCVQETSNSKHGWSCIQSSRRQCQYELWDRLLHSYLEFKQRPLVVVGGPRYQLHH
jgi:hypothetical protein